MATDDVWRVRRSGKPTGIAQGPRPALDIACVDACQRAGAAQGRAGKQIGALIVSSGPKLFNSSACRTAARTVGSVRASLAAGATSDRLFADAGPLWAHPFVAPCGRESRRPIG